MESSDPIAPDSNLKSRSRLLSRIATWSAIMLLTTVGLVIWDKYNYPIPYAIPLDPFWTDTTNLPSYLEPRRAAGSLQFKVREMRRARIVQHRLKQLKLPGSKWTVYSSNEWGLFEDATVTFDPNGSVLFKFGNKPEMKHRFLEFKTYERSPNGDLILNNETATENHQIEFDLDRPETIILRTESGDLLRLGRLKTP